MGSQVGDMEEVLGLQQEEERKGKKVRNKRSPIGCSVVARILTK